jgi:hypothetical protein
MKDSYDWSPLGIAAPGALGEARRRLHLAVQAAANLGRSYLAAPADYSHISLHWLPAQEALAGEVVEDRLRAALRFDPLEWLLLDAAGTPLHVLPLAGKTLARLEIEVRAVLAKQGLDASRYTLKPPFQVEPHPLLEGAAFAPETDADARRELAHHYAGTRRILDALAAELGVRAVPRVWPHHFDYALLHTLAGSGEEARSVNLGMSPGDHYYDEPYFYSSPWPYPAAERLPPLTPPAAWHTHEWTGGVLKSSALPPRAGAAVAAYWREAHAILVKLLD